MTFFESLLALLLAAILLLQVSRRLSLPYPAMLAAAGVAVALVPGAPTINIDPETALALFIAPALLDAAFDFPVGAIRKLWRPLFALAVVAVLLTAAVVAWIGVAYAGLPLAAALVLGAIVAPPDAAAATAMLAGMSLPRQTTAVLKGESLLNDAIALLLFSGALAVQAGGISTGVALHLAIAAPGGIVLGIVIAKLYRSVFRFVTGTLGGTLLEFVNTFWVWIIAERLGLSAVLCVVAFAMTIARTAAFRQRARVRVHTYAVWETVVFLLNVFAFLLMGMQAKTIVSGMPPDRLQQSAIFACIVLVAVILVRLVWVLVYNRFAARFALVRGSSRPPSLRQGVLVGWLGMRGLVTLATAFALPPDFPQRDLIVLSAFAVILGTLILQGLTLGPLIRLLGLDEDTGRDTELSAARHELALTALALLADKTGPAADQLRHVYEIKRDAVADDADGEALEQHEALGLAVVWAERKRLEQLRAEQAVGAEAFMVLQEELDFQELALISEEERHIEEG